MHNVSKCRIWCKKQWSCKRFWVTVMNLFEFAWMCNKVFSNTVIGGFSLRLWSKLVDSLYLVYLEICLTRLYRWWLRQWNWRQLSSFCLGRASTAATDTVWVWQCVVARTCKMPLLSTLSRYWCCFALLDMYSSMHLFAAVFCHFSGTCKELRLHIRKNWNDVYNVGVTRHCLTDCLLGMADVRQATV